MRIWGKREKIAEWIKFQTRSILKILGPFATASRRTPIHQVSLLLHAACASMSTTTTRDGTAMAP